MPNVGVSSHFAFYFKVCDARQDEQAEHVSLRSKQMKEFEDALPERFHNTIQKTVVTIKEMKKKMKTGDVVVYNTEVIYSRVMCLLNAKKIDLKDLLKDELPPVPLSLFDEDGDSRLAKQKADLKNTLKEEV